MAASAQSGLRLLEGIDDLAMLAMGAPRPGLERLGIEVEDRCRQFERGGEDPDEARAVGGARDGGVEIVVELVEAGQMAMPAEALEGRFHLGLDRFEMRDVGVGDAGGRATGRMPLELGAQTEHFGDVLLGEARHLAAPIALQDDEPFIAQPAEGLAHRGPADPDQFGQPRFLQRFAGGEIAGNDGLADEAIGGLDGAIGVGASAAGDMFIGDSIWRSGGRIWHEEGCGFNDHPSMVYQIASISGYLRFLR
jgi:hypothetical protein